MTLGWFRGGHTERLATGVLLLDYMATGTFYAGGHGASDVVELVSEGAVLLTFVWLALKSERWWPVVAAAALGLGAIVVVLEQVTRDLSWYASASAQLGLWMVVYLALLAGVGERRLAGEPPAGDAAVWRRRRVAP